MTDKIKRFAEENAGRKIIGARNSCVVSGNIVGYCLLKPLVLVKIKSPNNPSVGWLMAENYRQGYVFLKKVLNTSRFYNYTLSEIMFAPSKDEIKDLIEKLEL